MENIKKYPKKIWINLLYKCNYNCPMCGIKNRIDYGLLSFGLFLEMVDEIKSWNNDCLLIFTGGEPLLRDDLMKFLEISINNFATDIITNGYFIDEKLATQLLTIGLRSIGVSLDSTKAEIYDNIRGYIGAYEKTTDGLSTLINVKEKLKTQTRVGICCTVLKENFSNLVSLAKLAYKLKVDFLEYHPMVITYPVMKPLDSNYASNRIKILERQIRKLKKLRNKYRFLYFHYNPDYLVQYFKGKLTPNDWKCDPYASVFILPNGDVFGCKGLYGNIEKKGSLKKCLLSSEAESVRQEMFNCSKPCLQACWSDKE